MACDEKLTEITELRDVLQSWSDEKDISRAQQLSNIPHVLLPRVRIQTLLDLSKHLGSLRVLPKESAPTIKLLIASPWSTPSASPPRVLMQRNRELPR